jgi:hypothetical protein
LLLLLSSGFNAIQAAPFIWTPSSGSCYDFDWSNGKSDKGLFGNPTAWPTAASNTFSFTPSDSFRAESSNHTSGFKSDNLQFEIEAENAIQSIQFAESGEYAINGIGSVKAICAITIVNLDVYEVINKTFEIIPTLTAGEWSGSFAVNDIGWSHVRITMGNKLFAFSNIGESNSSWITKKDVGVNNNVGISIIMVPEPATIGILTMGSLVISIFGRKKH